MVAIRVVRNLTKTAAAAANPAGARRKPFIVAHDQLRLDLVHRIHRHTYDDQQRCSTEVEVHPEAVEQPTRESRVNPVPDQRQAAAA